MKTLIVDDEPHAVSAVEGLIAEYFPGVLRIVGSTNKAQEAIEMIDSIEPELVLIDIEMPFQSGFDVLESVSFKNFITVFITAYDHYAVKAFKANALDYILKPIDPKDFTQAIQKALESKKNTVPDFNNILNKDQYKRMAVPTREGYQLISPDEIMYINASGGYSEIFLSAGKKIVVSKNLKTVGEQLSPSEFLRISRSGIIRKDQVIEYSYQDGGSISLTDGSIHTVGRTYRKAVFDWLQHEFRVF